MSIHAPLARFSIGGRRTLSRWGMAFVISTFVWSSCSVRVNTGNAPEDITVEISDGEFAGCKLQCPAGAYSGTAPLTVLPGQRMVDPDGMVNQHRILALVGPPVEMGPSTEFSEPVTLWIPFSTDTFNAQESGWKAITVIAQDSDGSPVRLDTGPINMDWISLDTGPINLNEDHASLDTGPINITANTGNETYDALFALKVDHFTTFQVVAVGPCVPECSEQAGCDSDGCGGMCPPAIGDICVNAAPEPASCSGRCGQEGTEETCGCSAACIANDTCCSDLCEACEQNPELSTDPLFVAQCCKPSCDGKAACEDDGCGGWCSAGPGQICAHEVPTLEGDDDATVVSCVGICSLEVVGSEHCDCHPDCVAQGSCCQDLCQVCTDEVAADVTLEAHCCEPECTNKNCGDDGCGGSCGNCKENEACSDDGACACVPQCDNVIPENPDDCGDTCPSPGVCDESFKETCLDSVRVHCVEGAFSLIDCADTGEICELSVNGKPVCVSDSCEQTGCTAGDTFKVCALGISKVVDCPSLGFICKDDGFGHGNCAPPYSIQNNNACGTFGFGFCDQDTMHICNGTEWFVDDCNNAANNSGTCKTNETGEPTDGVTCETKSPCIPDCFNKLAGDSDDCGGSCLEDSPCDKNFQPECISIYAYNCDLATGTIAATNCEALGKYCEIKEETAFCKDF